MLEFDEYQLRPLQESDADSMARHANDRQVWLYLRDSFPHPYTVADALAWIQYGTGQPLGLNFGICQGHDCIGVIGIHPGEGVHRKTAELGYWLGQAYWGRGIVSQAVSLYTNFVQQQFELLRIYAEPFSSNPASARVLEKAGFVLEGRLRKNVVKDGQNLDSLLYAKTW